MLAALSFPAVAGDPRGEAPPIEPATDKVQPASAGAPGSSRGMSAAPSPTGPEDAEVERKRSEDERRATQSKEKMKSRPGYKENVPSPRG